MNHKKASLLCWVAAFLLICFTADDMQAQTTKPTDDNQIIQSLLNEVRLLRKTLQRTGLNTYRSQIIVALMQTHNEHVVRLMGQHEELRSEIEKIETTIPRFSEQAKVMEEQIEREADANKRVRLELEYRERKRDVERYKTLLEKRREREQQLTTQLRTEQTKLAELESRLEMLEREIEIEMNRQRSEDAAEEGKKKPE
jgi:predicted  nucleic acid-binding Zn-ribbon protein